MLQKSSVLKKAEKIKIRSHLISTNGTKNVVNISDLPTEITEPTIVRFGKSLLSCGGYCRPCSKWQEIKFCAQKSIKHSRPNYIYIYKKKTSRAQLCLHFIDHLIRHNYKTAMRFKHFKNLLEYPILLHCATCPHVQASSLCFQYQLQPTHAMSYP